MKRGKYISRACTSCQRRKVKCEGGDPCAQCIARKRPCISIPRGGGSHAGQAQDDTGPRDRDAAASATRSTRSADDVYDVVHVHTNGNGNGNGNGNSNGSTAPLQHEILARLASVERRLSMMQQLPSGHGYRGYGARSVDEHHSPTSAAELEKVLEPDGQTFAGEVSINRAFNGMAASVLDDGASPAVAVSTSPTSNSNSNSNGNGNSNGGHADENETRKVRGWLESIMESHGIVADEDEWRRSLALYLDEVYVLYPILHPPSLWAIFDGMWENSELWDLSNPSEREQKRLSVAMVCFCLALSRCSVPTRRTDANGVHSAGWGLYSVGVSLMQDVTGLSNTASKSLLTLQLLLLRVLYLFRLDATQGAARVLAIAVANGHIMGLHRQSTLERMPVYSSQMYSRVWWCLYVLDRRIALESGQPFLIQDANVDTAMPLEVSDEWLGRHITTTTATVDLQADIDAECAREPITSITYLHVRVHFSRIVGRAWGLLYGIRPPSATSPAMIECTDAMLCRLLSRIPRILAYNPTLPLEPQFRDRPRWLALQAIVLYTCCTFLRLLIQTLSLSSSLRSPDRTEDDELQSITICASLAAGILEGNNSISDDSLKYSFPISHYLTSATMVMATLVSKEPALKQKYASVILAATQSLHMYCHKTWVSGKMMRWVSRLGILVKRTLAENPAPAGQRLAHDPGIDPSLEAMDASQGMEPALDADAAYGEVEGARGYDLGDKTSPATTKSDGGRDRAGAGAGAGYAGAAAGEGPGAAWSAGGAAFRDLDMSSWLALPEFDLSSVMDSSVDFDHEARPMGLMTVSEDLLGRVKADGLGFGRDPLASFAPLGRTGFYGIDIDADVGGMGHTMGLGSPVLGIW